MLLKCITVALIVSVLGCTHYKSDETFYEKRQREFLQRVEQNTVKAQERAVQEQAVQSGEEREFRPQLQQEVEKQREEIHQRWEREKREAQQREMRQQEAPVTPYPSIPAASSVGTATSPLYQRALQDYQRGDYIAAVVNFKQFIQQNPQSPQAGSAQYLLGESLYAQKQYEAAIVAFDEVVQKYSQDPKVAAAMLKQGYAFAELKDLRNARFFLQQVQKKYPNSPEAQQAQNKLREIVDNYSSSLETQQPEAQHLCTSLGEAAASIIDMREARMPLDMALSVSHNAVLKSFSTQPNIANLDNFFRAMVEASYANPGVSASQAKAEITAACVKERLPERLLGHTNHDASLSETRQQSSIKAGTPSYAQTQQKSVVGLMRDLQFKGHKDTWDRAMNVINPVEKFNAMKNAIDKLGIVGDAIKTFEIVQKAGGNDAELCTHAATVSVAFLSVRYEDQYKDIKNIENAYCRRAGLPR